MKIVLTGGGTGGHFYPLMAIAESIHDIAREERLVTPRLYFIAPDPFDREALFENEILFIRSPAGKMRRYRSIRNLSDLFLTATGFLWSLLRLFFLYPDVVISKGGYTSVPVTLAARVLNIPVIVHESDSRPGRANLLASRFAARIAVAFASSIAYFPKNVQGKIARTGIPIRKTLTRLVPEGARQYLNLEGGIPVILILGGSQGSARINDTVLSALPELISYAAVIHQTGKDNIREVTETAKVVLEKSPHADRYHPYPYLSALSLERAAAVADVVVSRAGAGTIAEIAAWRKPAILIPIPESVSHDQRTNAYAFAETGAAVVLEEANLTPHVLASEIRRIVANPALGKTMGERGASFADKDAARIIADEAVEIALSHE
ncbi:MAG: UDP-N-acetylglucosamine--N-acetylmuramyl-(pentapeptide) pyrophosphoryl-undecaprenol N-acetylglucosamine transferase [Patescibacteria group bacterium]|nr:UDP-N-acetylglucosamine--N-acetylmuramyl-(pentapeptide) pyrophosphoryl-undecaprenol N-acetylglucosamine transferase [Patescibacteria group bacterium]MDE1965938.1 UDP-N-acetylglucosamine--N-acetylmuramyl-(pentapeptide) pyrophosphoryl-undecaprenol N-acetylglucosamine transferase [Patescibacteria group bacterium]